MGTRLNNSRETDEFPLISCVMPTFGRPGLVNEAVAMFLDQDYPSKELVILNDCVQQCYFSTLPGVRVHNCTVRFPTLGEKRNACIQLARGEFIAVWDDDDVYLPWRLSYSLEKLRQFDTPFYRPAEFLAYWGEEKLHDNRSVPGWVSHSTVLFSKELWRIVGGYPAQNVGEDATFFEAVHNHLNKPFIRYPIAPEDRFMILRGKSPYRHMSMTGGDEPLDTSPGVHLLKRTAIADPLLRRDTERQREARQSPLSRDGGMGGWGDGEQKLTVSPSPHPPIPPSRFAVTDTATAWADEPVLSVCVSLCNRSRVEHERRVLKLFPNCVRSLKEASRATGPIELVVADFSSSDWPLHQWLPREATPTLRIKVVSLDEPFSRGRGLNVAARHALCDRLFLCDSDILVDAGALRRGLHALEKGRVSFPICRYLDPHGQPEYWQDAGLGLVFLHRQALEQAGGVPEFQSWGGEDDLLRSRIRQFPTSRSGEVRQRDPGLFHQWHPEEIRHIHYARGRKSDFEGYVASLSATPGSPSPTVLRQFVGRHPLWTGSANTIQLFDDGLMHRVGVDRGRYELANRVRIVLLWDNWPAEILLWNERTQCYEDPTKAFTLREINSPNEFLPASPAVHAVRQQFSELAQHLKGIAPFQFLSLPGNWGDAIIRSGTLAFFRHLGVDFVEIPNPQAARSSLPAVLGGSGGFCRFWNLAPRLLRELVDQCNRVVVLPSTYELPAIPNLHAFDNLTFYARELFSMQEMGDYRMQFCPDMAFWNPVPCCPPPAKQELNAFRTDRETLGFSRHVSSNRDISLEHDASGDWRLFFSELAQYEHIRTDRAHVAIASAMLGRRVTFYPNAYHKNEGIFECSLRHFEVSWKSTLGEE